MPVGVFAASQPWGSAAAHQRDHPGAWTPELVATTASWTEIVRAIVQAQSAWGNVVGEGSGTAAMMADKTSSFAWMCTQDAQLCSHLDLVCERGLHELLVSWVMEGVRERITTHAVPSFWQRYRELVSSTGAAPGGARRLGLAVERRFQSSFFYAVRDLARYVNAQVELVALIDGKRWHEVAASGVGVLSGATTARCEEVTTLVQACVLAQAPETHTLAHWLTVCWQRSFADITGGRGGGGGGRSRMSQSSDDEGNHAEEEEEEEEEEADAWIEDDEEGEEEGEGADEADSSDGMLVDESASAVLAAAAAANAAGFEPLRACCEGLHTLGWLPLVEPSLSAMLHKKLHASLVGRCAKRFDERLLHRVLGWRKRAAPFLRVVLMPTASPASPPSPSLQQWLSRLRFFLMQSLATLRISELFDVIVDYPDSLPALTDLKECLTHTHQHAEAVASLAEAIEARLLKPGADTANIIQVYVSAIKALRQLDPTGVTLEAVSDRVRTYLKARADTVRQIVTSLTDPETSELLEDSSADDGAGAAGAAAGGAGGSGVNEAELQMEDTGAADGEVCDLDELKGDEAAMLEWTPDPIQADPSRSSSRRTADVLSILVNIYGSKALFVNEYRSMLADKLLAASDYETDRDLRNLELLKKRFGEAALHSCEVMLRDIAESKRVTRAVQRHLGDDAQILEATIVSRLSWPSLPSESFTLPAEMQGMMDRFEKQYMHHKAPRKIVWKPSLGCVTIDVAFQDKTVKGVQCTPLQASIIYYFGEQSKWGLFELSAKLKVETDILKKRIVYWINRGFIHEVGRSPNGDVHYEAPTHLGAGGEGRPQIGEEEEEAGGGTAEAEAAEEMKVYEQYIIGMLTNLESLPLGRIHNMLKMFVPANTLKSEQELQRFLNRLVEDGKLELVGGQFKIKA